MRHSLSRPVVLCDVDGVIADFASAFLGAYERFSGEHVAREVWHRSYDLFEGLGHAAPDEGLRGRVSDFVASEAFHLELEPFPGAIEGVRALAEVSEVWFVTSPWKGSREWTFLRDRWLCEKFGGVSGLTLPGHIIYARKKHLVFGDVLVDDLPENVDAWKARHATGLAVLWATGHNDVPGAYDLRIRDWGEVLQRVMAMQGERR